MTDLPRIIRESCLFHVDESPEEIETRIAQTRATAQIMGVQIGLVAQHVSELYGPTAEEDIQGMVGYPGTLDWREALSQCHYGRFGRYTVVVRDMDEVVPPETTAQA